MRRPEDDETFDENDKPIVQVGDMLPCHDEPRRTTVWCVAIEGQIGDWAGTICGYGQTDVEAELDAYARAAAAGLKVTGPDE